MINKFRKREETIEKNSRKNYSKKMNKDIKNYSQFNINLKMIRSQNFSITLKQ